jgi:tetratricopeptide (TPR) repeat protein
LATLFGGHDVGVCARSVAASAQVTAGQFDAAVGNTVDAISLAEALHHPHSMAHAFMNALTTAATVRDPDRLQEWGAGLSAVAETYNFPLQRAVAAFFFEWGKALSGDADLARLRSTFNALLAIGPFTLLYTALFAEELLKAGRTDDALTVIDDFVGTLRFPAGFYLPEVYRVRGQCLAALGRHEEAIGELRHAGRVAGEQGAELFVLRAALARARNCLSDEDRRSAAAAVERSLEAIGKNDWPEIVAAREAVARGKDPSQLIRMSRQSAATSME